MMRRWLLVTLLGALCLSCLTVPAALAETVTLDGMVYELRDGYANFAGFASGAESAVIHTVVNGCQVQYMTDAELVENFSIKEITFGEEIGDLDQINSLQSLLYWCKALDRIVLPDTLVSIGENLSYSSYSLREYAVAGSSAYFQAVDGVLYDKSGTMLLAFPVCKGERYDIPAGVRSIGAGAFGFNEHLKYLALPEGITQLKQGTLGGLTALEDLVLPASLCAIENGALPGTVTMKRVAVAGDNPLFQSIDGVLFSKDGKTLVFFPSGKGGQYDIPSGTTAVMKDAFGYNTSLQKLTLPEGITELPDGALCLLSGITQLSLPASLRTIGQMALPGYGALEQITVADGNKQYQTYEGVLFSRDGKTLLRCPAGRKGTYEIPAGTILLANSAFDGCETLTGITVPDGITALPQNIFSGSVGLEEISLPATISEIGDNALPCDGVLRRVEVMEGNRRYRSVDGVLFEGEELIYFPLCHGPSYDVPAGTARIRNGAFTNNEMLETVSIPRSVTEIGEGTFYLCASLARVSLPITLTRIGRSAFANCIALSDITLPPGLAVLEESAFYNCPSLAQIRVPDGITVLDAYVFGGHSPDFMLYASKQSAGYWHAWEYGIPWAEPGGVPGIIQIIDRQTQSAVVNNASNQELSELFSKPEAGAKSLGKYANGTTVQVLDKKGIWAHVQLYGAEGYMPIEALMLTDSYNQIVRITWGRKRQDTSGPLRLYAEPSGEAPSEDITEDVSVRILDTVGVWYHVLLKEKEGYVQVQNLNVACDRTRTYEDKDCYVVSNPNSQDRLHLREEPSTKSRSLGRYFNGTQVEVIDYGPDGWAHVCVNGKEGYMMTQYLVAVNWGGESSLWGHG